MKIAILSFYSGERSRGVETYVHELANHLTDLGHNISVYQNGLKRENSKYKTVSLGLKIDWSQNSGVPLVSYWPMLVRKFTEECISNFDGNENVVLTTNGQWQSILVRKWTRKNKVKHVVAGQSGPGIDDRINLACTPDSFVALTNYQKEWAKKAVPFIKQNRTDVIPNGVDLKRFLSSKKINLDLPKPIFLNVAALESLKRQQLAIKAVSKLKQGSLLIVGKGDLQSKLQQLGDELLPGRFLIQEYQYEDMPSVYASADVFTFPTSPWESFGIVMLEAMVSGLPVVASNDPIRREIVGDAGIFVDPENTEEYAVAMQKAIDMKWGNKPQKQAEKFSWDKIAKQYESLFEKLVG